MIYLWVDESDKHGSFYSNFYGGILILSSHYNHVIDTLNQAITDLRIDEEIKWQKVNEYWLERYTALVDVIFKLMVEGYIKIRIFFPSQPICCARFDPKSETRGVPTTLLSVYQTCLRLGVCQCKQTIGICENHVG